MNWLKQQFETLIDAIANVFALGSSIDWLDDDGEEDPENDSYWRKK